MTKKEAIKRHLLRRTPITSFQAFTLYGVTRLAAVVFSLRKEGYIIETIDKKTDDGTVYGEYKLISSPINMNSNV